MSANLTPMMRQYLDIKRHHQDAILFFRLGDFYEMFFDDAAEATRILHITLTSREAGKGRRVPMCGVPYHAASNYIARLVKHGRKVAICEQVEKPAPGKPLVKREITKIITPGTFMTDELLGGAVNNYILSLSKKDNRFGLAYADISTGEFRVTEIELKESLYSELYKIAPLECLVPESFTKEKDFNEFKEAVVSAVTVNEDWMFDVDLSHKQIKEHFALASLEGFGCGNLTLAIGSAGALLRYLENTQKSSLANIDRISPYRLDQFMTIDRNSQRHLELTQNQDDFSAKGTLYGVLDRAMTAMGKRRLRSLILNPLLDAEQIRERLDSVEYFYANTDERKKIRDLLGGMYDIERLSNKASLGTANAKDLNSLAHSLRKISGIKDTLKTGSTPPALGEIIRRMDEFKDVAKWIESALREEAPCALKEGGLIKKGYDSELDRLNDISTSGKDWVSDLEKKEIGATGIGSLKVGYNRVFGYYIEVTNANLKAVPSYYTRKQTLAGSERFVTPELKEREVEIISAEERCKELEYEIFCRLRDKVAGQMERFKKTCEQIALVDLFSNFAEVAAANHYTRPKMNDGSGMKIKDGRHAVIEKVLGNKEFIPNDVRMDAEGNRIFIITGSNMAGKSTLIRQVALIAIMAQIGSFVPAKEAEIGIIDRIFTRVGAADRLLRGMSTFLTEMVETANILNNAGPRSLIVLDEIGRGTSTFDGVSIAWAVVEYINRRIPGAKVMFATHYHELTELVNIMKGVKNYHMAVRQWKGRVVFLYKLTEGGCDESFGIHVAGMAGLPGEVVNRAREILDNLQKDSFKGNIRGRFSGKKESGGKQFDFFENAYRDHPLIERIRGLDIDNLTPLEALKKIAEFKKDL